MKAPDDRERQSASPSKTYFDADEDNELMFTRTSMGAPRFSAAQLIVQARTSVDVKDEISDWEVEETNRLNRLRKAFDSIDTNKDGKLDQHDIKKALSKAGLPVQPNTIHEIMMLCDHDKDGFFGFPEFVAYVSDKEQELRVLFDELDQNKDGKLCLDDLRKQLKRLNIVAEDSDLRKLLDKIDSTGDGMVTFHEWQQFLMLLPTASPDVVFDVWQKAAAIDLGDSISFESTPDVVYEFDRAWKLLFSGGVAGAVSRTVTAPLDRLKLLMQMGKSNAGVLSGLTYIYSREGFRGYFRGNGVNVMKIGPESAIKFWVYENIKTYIAEQTNSENVGTSGRLVSGGLAGMTAQTLIYPMEIMKTRLAVSPVGYYRSFFHCGSMILNREGPLAFYKGLVPALLGVLPYAAVDLACYETLKHMYMRVYEIDEPGIITLLGCGAVSSCAGQTFSYPFALVRTRLQAEGMAGRQPKYTGMIDCFRKTLVTDGFSGLYRGIVPNFLKVVPAVSISYVVYEHMKRHLKVETS